MARRDKTHQNTMLEIKDIARKQMAEQGTAGLSLSAIAREMEISAPGLYRYYSSRDDLITALIIDAYTDLAIVLDQTSLQHSAQQPADRLYAVILAYREWALLHPIDFQLIYGNPIPEYHAPEDTTTAPAQRGFAVILNILLEAFMKGELSVLVEQFALPADLKVGLFSIDDEIQRELPEIVIYAGLVGWYHIHGMIMLELFHHTQSLINDTGAFYRFEVKNLLTRMGMQPNF